MTDYFRFDHDTGLSRSGGYRHPYRIEVFVEMPANRGREERRELEKTILDQFFWNESTRETVIAMLRRARRAIPV